MDKVHREAVKAEERVAYVFNGRRTAASGSGTKDKADVITESELFEVKYTERNSYSLKFTDLKQLEVYADLVTRRPVFHITGPLGSYVVLTEGSYRGMEAWIESAKFELNMLWY